MQFHPTNNTLYFSCNGRDNIGDNVPDDYIGYAPTAGLDFGYPYCHRWVRTSASTASVPLPGTLFCYPCTVASMKLAVRRRSRGLQHSPYSQRVVTPPG